MGSNNKQWESLKAQKQPATSSTSRPICDEPIPHQGSYYQWGSAADWGKNLDSLPALTRREIDLHIDTVNMKFRPQKDSTRVSKPAIRGAHLLAERYLNSDTISTRSDNNFFYCRATCFASKESCERKLSVAIRFTDSRIMYAHCDCPAGLGGACNPMHALLLELANYHLHNIRVVPEEVACTSILSQWVVPRSRGKIDKQPVMDVKVKRLNI